ncbi:MAG: T9SS type A sorting domain-containing protein, partial [Saprospiraceae bacterium]
KEGYFQIAPGQVWWIIGGGGSGTDQTTEAAATETLLVSPNPVHGTATFEAFSADDAEATLRIVGMNGQLVQLANESHVALAKGQNSFTLDVGHLPAGTYSVQLIKPDKVLATKLVKL